MPRLRLVVWLAAAALAAVWLTAAARQTPAPILILISFDGWRWDYLDFESVDAQLGPQGCWSLSVSDGDP